jgi:hypothetical protein
LVGGSSPDDIFSHQRGAEHRRGLAHPALLEPVPLDIELTTDDRIEARRGAATGTA